MKSSLVTSLAEAWLGGIANPGPDDGEGVRSPLLRRECGVVVVSSSGKLSTSHAHPNMAACTRLNSCTATLLFQMCSYTGSTDTDPAGMMEWRRKQQMFITWVSVHDVLDLDWRPKVLMVPKLEP